MEIEISTNGGSERLKGKNVGTLSQSSTKTLKL